MSRGCSRLKEVPNLQLSSSLYTPNFLISRSRIFSGSRRLDQSIQSNGVPRCEMGLDRNSLVSVFDKNDRSDCRLPIQKRASRRFRVCPCGYRPRDTESLSPWRLREVLRLISDAAKIYFRTPPSLGVYIASDNSQPPHLLATFSLDLSKGHACEHSSNASCQLQDLLHPGMRACPPLGLHHYRWPCPTSRG
jgi:hypothetical protein